MLALLAGCAMVAACGRAAPTPNNMAAAPPAATMPAGNVAAPVPVAPTQAPASEWVLTSEGMGPLRIGMTVAEIEAAAGPDDDPDAIGGPEPERCDQFHPARAPAGVLVMVEEGRLTRISLIREASARTDRGRGIGDAAAAVREAYGASLKEEPHEYLHPQGAYLTQWARGGPAGRQAYVEDSAARGIRYEIGRTGRVEIIHGGGPSIQYVEGCA